MLANITAYSLRSRLRISHSYGINAVLKIPAARYGSCLVLDQMVVC